MYKKSAFLSFSIGLSIFIIAFLSFKDMRLKKIDKKEERSFNCDAIKKTENIVPFLVLGSGPASLAAALYGARTRVHTVVLKGNQPGGQLTGTSYIENWPGVKKIRGLEIVKECEMQAARFGAIMVNDSAVDVDLSTWPYKVKTEEGRELQALALFIGTGAKAKCLNVPGEQEYWGRGVTTCAICDAPYYQGEDVVVVGGGDSAVEEAIELASYAKNVFMLVRSEALRASPTMLQHLYEFKNVKIMFNMSVSLIKGDGKHVAGIQVKNNKTSEIQDWDNIKAVFLAVGHTPNVQIFRGQIPLNKEGYIELDGRSQTTLVPGVFAAGDVADPIYKQAGVAAGDGIKGGLDAVWWLSEIGYNDTISKQLEPFFFNSDSINSIELAAAHSEQELKQLFNSSEAEIYVLDFYTPFCPSCMHMLPVVEWAQKRFGKKVLFVKIDASHAFDLVKRFQVPQVPHVLIIKGDEVIERSDVAMNRVELFNFVKKYSS